MLAPPAPLARCLSQPPQPVVVRDASSTGVHQPGAAAESSPCSCRLGDAAGGVTWALQPSSPQHFPQNEDSALLVLQPKHISANSTLLHASPPVPGAPGGQPPLHHEQHLPPITPAQAAGRHRGEVAAPFTPSQVPCTHHVHPQDCSPGRRRQGVCFSASFFLSSHH